MIAGHDLQTHFAHRHRGGRALLVAVGAEAEKKHESFLDTVVDGYEAHHSYQLPAAGTLEVAFSPNEGSEALVAKVIDSAKSELRVLAYSFTSAPVTAALLRAKKRGVDVRAVVDHKSNVSEDRSTPGSLQCADRRKQP